MAELPYCPFCAAINHWRRCPLRGALRDLRRRVLVCVRDGLDGRIARLEESAEPAGTASPGPQQSAPASSPGADKKVTTR